MADCYKTLKDLKKNHVEKEDYVEEFRYLDKEITVLAVHGGHIEPITEYIAEGIAKEEYNLYFFKALKEEYATKFHITSHRFEHEKLEEVLLNSDAAISIHGCGSKKKEITHIGGLNKKLKKLVREHLKREGFSVGSKRWPAVSTKNVVNRTKNRGVQLELTRGLRDSFLDEDNNFNQTFFKYVGAIRKAIEEYKSLED